MPDELGTFTKDYLTRGNISVDPSLYGFLPSEEKFQLGQQRAEEKRGLLNESTSLGMNQMRTGATNQMVQSTGGQGLASYMGGGFGARQRGMVRDISQATSAYSSGLAGLQHQKKAGMAGIEYDRKMSEFDFGDDLMDRIMKLNNLYADKITLGDSGGDGGDSGGDAPFGGTFTSIPNDYQGATIYVNGVLYNWNEASDSYQKGYKDGP
jgi:hypothetical protein